MQAFTRELRHAWRSLGQRKAYFFTCAATLALVLGANAAMFAVVNATMLRPLPFTARGRIVYLYAQPPGTTSVPQRNPLQQMEVPRIRERARTIARLEGFYISERVVTLAGEPGVAQGAAVTPGLLKMMAAPVAQGRSFTDAEGEPGHLVALVSDRYWRDTLDGRAELVLDVAELVADRGLRDVQSIRGPCDAFSARHFRDEPQVLGFEEPAHESGSLCHRLQ